jgi:hypothetical protein
MSTATPQIGFTNQLHSEGNCSSLTSNSFQTLNMTLNFEPGTLNSRAQDLLFIEARVSDHGGERMRDAWILAD